MMYEKFTQGDWAWLKRLPSGNFGSINPKTRDIFELVCISNILELTSIFQTDHNIRCPHR